MIDRHTPRAGGIETTGTIKETALSEELSISHALTEAAAQKARQGK